VTISLGLSVCYFSHFGDWLKAVCLISAVSSGNGSLLHRNDSVNERRIGVSVIYQLLKPLANLYVYSVSLAGPIVLFSKQAAEASAVICGCS
jgi:hypothetical protein